ncbi:ATP-dependent helicase [Persicirhabdus sediminis]|uniref:DNA 3'-5' helicase n=1 Tax=Persicirhabdus sediminis TaxID=454144 RepID=A0A8J7MFP4_9BACT|nr:UvrD-helicase domain-containing protein [Persicirhabdus sediminis]MBK1791383.1 UvrD-helicase domain-containing protein [Persicirhabdus sediminis]
MSFNFSSLNPAQRDAVSNVDGPVLILAGAGTGKTRTVTCRIAHMIELGVKAENILALTFTNKAAAEMRERVAGMVSKSAGKEVTVCTFHSLCVRLLRQDIEKLGYKKNFTIFTGNDQTGTMKQLIIRKGGIQEKIEPGVILSYISKEKNGEHVPEMADDEFLQDLANAYKNELRAQNAIDFDDLLVLGERLLREHADVRAVWQDQFKRITVDEFQDTNGLQMKLLQQLVKSPEHHVCVVGDDDQSIYGWRGADVTNILNFERFFPDPHIIRLEENYRSSEAIIHTANSVIVNNIGRREKQLRAVRAGGDKLRVIAMPGDEEEAEFIAEEIHETHFVNKRPLEDIAILFRTNGQIRKLEHALRELKIPYRMVGAQSFYDRKEVRDTLSYLHVLANPTSDVHLLRILNAPPRGIGNSSAILLSDLSREKQCSVWEAMGSPEAKENLSTRAFKAVQAFSEMVERYREEMEACRENKSEILKRMMAEIEYIEWVKRNCKTESERDMRHEGMSEVISALHQASRRGKTLQKFLDDTSLERDKDDDDLEKQRGVTLITLHSSKGLEYPLVYLVGLEQGILPHKRSVEEGTLDEERRLFYVGITRAGERLAMTWCARRKKYGEEVMGQASQFMGEMDPKFLSHEHYDDIMGAEASEEDTENFFANLKSLLDD